MFKVFKNRLLKDNRGFLHKVYNEEILKNTKFKPVETFFSNYSQPNVIRGIYMQTGKYCEAKLLTLLYGDIRWLILDLRKKSDTYLKYKFIKLKKNNTYFIPEGFAHGSISMKESLVYIMANKVYNAKKSVNIHWRDKTLKVRWPILKRKKIIISKMHSDYRSLEDNKKLL